MWFGNTEYWLSYLYFVVNAKKQATMPALQHVFLVSTQMLPSVSFSVPLTHLLVPLCVCVFLRVNRQAALTLEGEQGTTIPIFIGLYAGSSADDPPFAAMVNRLETTESHVSEGTVG